jgi:hypothetical protein
MFTRSELILRVAAVFFPAARRFLVIAAFFAAALRFFVVAAFLAALPRVLVAAAFCRDVICFDFAFAGGCTIYFSPLFFYYKDSQLLIDAIIFGAVPFAMGAIMLLLAIFKKDSQPHNFLMHMSAM